MLLARFGVFNETFFRIGLGSQNAIVEPCCEWLGASASLVQSYVLMENCSFFVGNLPHPGKNEAFIISIGTPSRMSLGPVQYRHLKSDRGGLLWIHIWCFVLRLWITNRSCRDRFNYIANLNIRNRIWIEKATTKSYVQANSIIAHRLLWNISLGIKRMDKPSLPRKTGSTGPIRKEGREYCSFRTI